MPMPRARLRLFALIPVVALLLWFVQAARAQDDATDAARLVRVLEIKAGQSLAEIGAGGGALTMALAREVGASGRVYSSELGESRVEALRQAVTKAELPQVTVITGEAAATSLPEECCDALFMRNVYHHFADPVAMDGSILRSLKPGGRVAVIDFSPRGGKEAARPEDRDEEATHGVTADTVAAELKQAGFEIISIEPSKDRWFIVLARKPA